MAEYRPRIRPSRNHPVTRRDNVLIVVCENSDTAERIQLIVENAIKEVAAGAPILKLYTVPGLGKQEG